jgi:hypothetical protein
MLFIGTTRDHGVNYCLPCSQRRAPCDLTLLACHSACPELAPKGFFRLDLSFFHLAGPYSCIAAAPKPHAFDTGSHLSGYRVYQDLRALVRVTEARYRTS